MKTGAEHSLLQAIFNEMQSLKKCLTFHDERRVSIKEFAQRMNMSIPTLYDRINKGEINPPFKDGPRSYHLNSYVNEIVTKQINNATVAA